MKKNYELKGVCTFISEDKQKRLGYVDMIPLTPHLYYEIPLDGNSVKYFKKAGRYYIIYDFMIDESFTEKEGLKLYPHLFL